MSETLFNNTMSKIEKYGFTIIYTHNESTDYGYTIGMAQFGMPDMVLTGLGPDYVLELLEILGNHFIEKREMVVGEQVSEVFDMPIKLLPVAPTLDSSELFFQKHQFDEKVFHKSTDMVTVVYPDRNGKTLGEIGADKSWFDATAAFTAMLN